jgi:hypothetical protein
MGKVKYQTREIHCKDCNAITVGYAYMNLKTLVTSKPEYCASCAEDRMQRSGRPTPDGQVKWVDAFDKYGYEDGDGTIHTPAIAEFLESKGYQVEYESYGHHNTIITELIDPNGKLVVRIGEGGYKGYEDPRGYLPAKLVEMLDEEFGNG